MHEMDLSGLQLQVPLILPLTYNHTNPLTVESVACYTFTALLTMFQRRLYKGLVMFAILLSFSPCTQHQQQHSHHLTVP